MNIVPFKKLAVVVNKITAEAVPVLSQHGSSKLREIGIEAVFLPVEKSAEEVFAQLPSDVQAAYIAPLILVTA